MFVLGSSVEPCGGPDVTQLVVSALCATTRRAYNSFALQSVTARLCRVRKTTAVGLEMYIFVGPHALEYSNCCRSQNTSRTGRSTWIVIIVCVKRKLGGTVMQSSDVFCYGLFKAIVFKINSISMFD